MLDSQQQLSLVEKSRPMISRIAPAALLAAFSIGPACADVVYTYTGNDFTSTTSPYTTDEYVTVTMDYASTLQPNLVDSAVTPVSWSFSDGVNTAINSTSGCILTAHTVSTNASGQITSWSFGEFDTDSSSDTPAISTTNTEDIAYAGSATQTGSVSGAPRWVDRRGRFVFPDSRAPRLSAVRRRVGEPRLDQAPSFGPIRPRRKSAHAARSVTSKVAQ